MEEYASARLLELAQRALAAEGIRAVAPVTGGALLPPAAKRAYLAEVAREHGLLPLLRVGSTLSGATSDPLIAALLNAVGPRDLLERWRRLERFQHSRHRTVVREYGPRHLVVEHIGPPGAPPEPAEDALVLGVLTALLTLSGARDVRVTAGSDRPVTVFSDGLFRAPPPRPGGGLWRFAWSAAPPGDGIRTGEAGATGKPGEPGRSGTDRADGAAGRDEVALTRRLIAADPARRWTLGGLAAELGVPARSLQRRLAGAGGFSGLLAAVRSEAAAELLIRGDHPIGIIGFVCGYADQPHFTRQFGRRTALTPAVYRSVFQDPGGRTSRAGEPTRRRTP
ncbi:helix-turn-helix transcriptional regulator [Streptomyces sp. NPDC006798]|uniref:helix-turn-helix transcriptional regulator n=1 Tax=Streptomyces sp. NPDC006798 TaxID=3155462 RepID=UPI0033CD8E03